MPYFIGIADKKIPTIATQNNRIQGLAIFTERTKAETHIRDLKSRSKFDILELGKELLVPDFIIIVNTFYTTIRSNKQGIIHRLPSTHFGDMPIYLDLAKPDVTGGANFTVIEFMRMPELVQTAFRDDNLFFHNGFTVSLVEDKENGKYFAVVKLGAYDSAEDMKKETNEQPHIVASQTTKELARDMAIEYIASRNS